MRKSGCYVARGVLGCKGNRPVDGIEEVDSRRRNYEVEAQEETKGKARERRIREEDMECEAMGLSRRSGTGTKRFTRKTYLRF